MKNESVAVLDVRSYEVTFLIGAKGVNGTFVFRDGKSEKYVRVILTRTLEKLKKLLEKENEYEYKQ